MNNEHTIPDNNPQPQLPLPGIELSHKEPISNPLLQVEERETQGVSTQFKYGYQRELITRACISMLRSGSSVKAIAIELHEDYVIEYEDGHFDFCQVKHKDEGQQASFSTMSEALHNLFSRFKEFSQPSNVFTLQCNRGAHSSSGKTGNLWELKDLLTKKRQRALDHREETRLRSLKLYIHSLSAFQDEAYELVDTFIEGLQIATGELSEEAVRIVSERELLDVLRIHYSTPYLNVDQLRRICQDIYDLVEKTSRERNDRSKRILNKQVILDLIPLARDLVEFGDPLSSEAERQILGDLDPDCTILESKCKKSDVEEIIVPLEEVKVIARNRNDHYQGNVVALNYIGHLRAEIKLLCSSIEMANRSKGLPVSRPGLYSEVSNTLNKLAERESQNDFKVRVDPVYIHGLYAQLVSECKLHP